MVLLKAKLIGAITQVYEDELSVAEGLRQWIKSNPRAARMVKIELRADGKPDPESLKKAASTRVLIRKILK